MRRNVNSLVFGCALAFVTSIGIILWFNFSPPDEKGPNISAIALAWLGAFFFPPFLASRHFTDRGAIYGLIVGVVPLMTAFFAGYDAPLIVLLFFYAFAPLGGFLGQRFSGGKNAS